jgi:hypothetical protein
MKRALPPKSELRRQLRAFEATFSGFALLRETWGGGRKREGWAD